MAAMMLMLIKFNNGCPLLNSINIIAAICWLPPLILCCDEVAYMTVY